MTVTADAFIRPSNIARLAACPGAAQMSAAFVNLYGQPEESGEASIGTRVHAFAAMGVGLWRDSDEHGGVIQWGEAIAMACNAAAKDGMDHWSVWCVQATLEFYRDLIAEHQIDPENVLPEHALDMDAFGFRRKGTSDLVLVVPFELVVIVDLKAGFLDQGDAEDHDQMMVYALAASATFQAKKIITYLWQPRVEKAKRATAAAHDASSLAANADWTRSIIDAARSPTAELRPGYEQCRYCPCLTRCPSAKEWIMNVLESVAALGAPMDPDAWGELAAAAKIAERLGKDAKEQVKEHLLKGGAATGWGLGSGRAIRSCTSPAEALRRLDAAGMGDLAREALGLSVASLPTEAVAVIADLVQEKPSAPSLKAIKSKAAA